MSELLTAFEIASKKVPSHPIPPMTDPMGKHWPQPDRFEIEIDETHALMSQSVFDALANYTNSQPSGVYPGKMWKAFYKLDGWCLLWWVESPMPNHCQREGRKILIV